jgi:hypothetical protein
MVLVARMIFKVALPQWRVLIANQIKVSQEGQAFLPRQGKETARVTEFLNRSSHFSRN